MIRSDHLLLRQVPVGPKAIWWYADIREFAGGVLLTGTCHPSIMQ